MTEARMSEVNTPALGSFCWVELATNDQAAAKKFYTQLFDWNIKDVPMGPNSVYTMLQIEERMSPPCINSKRSNNHREFRPTG